MWLSVSSSESLSGNIIAPKALNSPDPTFPGDLRLLLLLCDVRIFSDFRARTEAPASPTKTGALFSEKT